MQCNRTIRTLIEIPLKIPLNELVPANQLLPLHEPHNSSRDPSPSIAESRAPRLFRFVYLSQGEGKWPACSSLIPCPVSRYIYPRFKKTSSLRRFRTTLFDPRPPPRIRSILFSDRDGERNPSGNSKDRDKWLKKAFRPARGIIGRGKGTSWIREFLFLTKVFGINSNFPSNHFSNRTCFNVMLEERVSKVFSFLHSLEIISSVYWYRSMMFLC